MVSDTPNTSLEDSVRVNFLCCHTDLMPPILEVLTKKISIKPQLAQESLIDQFTGLRNLFTVMQVP